MSENRLDRLYDLLPAIVRDSDAYAGNPLQALLRVMAEQSNLVEDDITAMLDNWFVETCDEWVLPYLGELLGREQPAEVPPPPPDGSPRGLERARAAYPRRAFARLVHSRRRKGVLLQLQDLARDLAGWPARAVEFRPNIAAAWSARFPHRGGARTVDLRDAERLDREGGPFATLSRRNDVRPIASEASPGRGNLLSVGLYVWRLEVNTIQAGLAGHHHPPTPHAPHHHNDFRLDRYWLNPFGLDAPLFALAEPLPDPTEPAGELEVPAAIRPAALAIHLKEYYGPEKSLYLWRTHLKDGDGPAPYRPPPVEDAVPADAIFVHDLADWEASLPAEHPAVAEGSCWEGAVMGAFHDLYLSYRESLLRAALAAYVPADADARLFFVT